MTNTLNLKFKTEDGKGKVSEDCACSLLQQVEQKLQKTPYRIAHGVAAYSPDMDLNKETVDAAMTAIQESKILETKGTVIVGIEKAEYVQTVTTPVA